MTCHCCSGATKLFGRYRNKNRLVQRYRCVRCSKTFSEAQPMQGLHVDFGKACQTVHLLCEGMGIRAISRFTGLHQQTVLKILEMAGARAVALLDRQIRDVEVESVQCDELFCFVFSKERNNLTQDTETGSQYTFLAVDRKSKLILSHCIGKRDRPAADAFMADLRKRVKGRCQLTTDGYQAYLMSVYNAFGANVDYARQIKTYADHGQNPMADERRY